MRKVLLIILFVIQNLYSFSQNDSEITNLSKFWIKTTPLHYIDFYNGTNCNIGVECKLNSKISMNTEFGKIFNLSNDSYNQFRYISGFSLRHEVKKYEYLQTNENTYFSLEGSFDNQSFTRSDFITFNSDSTYQKNYLTVRTFFGISFLRGWVKHFDCGLILEGIIGLGLRYNMVRNDLTEEESMNRDLGDWTNPMRYLIKKGNHIIPRFHAGIKVGWRILN